MAAVPAVPKGQVRPFLFWLAIPLIALSACFSGERDDPEPVTYEISGRVEAASRCGSVDIAFSIRGNGSDFVATGSTDGDGKFSVGGVPNGDYTLLATKPRYAFSPAMVEFTVAGGDVTGISMSAVADRTGNPADGSLRLPRTGQLSAITPCDDGDLRKGEEWPAPRFSANADGTVTDNLTGLVWLQHAACFGRQSWSAALAAINGLRSGSCGLTDGSAAGAWRLPNIHELESLVDLSRYYPVLPSGHPFMSVISDTYWSSTSYSTSRGFALAIGMDGGWLGAVSKIGQGYAWAVRGSTTSLSRTGQTGCFDREGRQLACPGTGQDGDKLAGFALPSPRFVDNMDGTLTDRLTGLVWLNGRCPTLMAWSEAVGFANALASGACGLTDGSVSGQWRLPNRKELLSVVYPPAGGNPYFPSTNFYWTSSSYAGSSSSAWMMTVDTGYVLTQPKDLQNSVRPVRDGP